MRDKPIGIPEDFFDFEGERPDDWPDNPDIRRAVEWMRSYVGEAEWKSRRLAAARRVYDLITVRNPARLGVFLMSATASPTSSTWPKRLWIISGTTIQFSARASFRFSQRSDETSIFFLRSMASGTGLCGWWERRRRSRTARYLSSWSRPRILGLAARFPLYLSSGAARARTIWTSS